MNELIDTRKDFAVLIEVLNGNPNGNTIDGSPRIDSLTGIGEITGECIRHKVRMRAQDEGESILIQGPDHLGFDGFNSIEKRVRDLLGEEKRPSVEQAEILKKSFFDVRLFGGMCPLKKSDDGNNALSINVKPAVTMDHMAQSVDPVRIRRVGITKSVNGMDVGDAKAPDTMGAEKTFVEYGLYVIHGSINPLRGFLNGLTEDDIKRFKNYLRTCLYNDESCARPAGSMTIRKVYWWEHNKETEKYPVADVHKSLIINKKGGVRFASGIQDYDVKIDNSYQTEEIGFLDPIEL